MYSEIEETLYEITIYFNNQSFYKVLENSFNFFFFYYTFFFFKRLLITNI